VYGRIDIFTAKRKDDTCKFDWYVNEVQNHGLEPEIIYPEIINVEEEKDRKRFHSIFPVRYNSVEKDALDLEKLPNLLTFLRELATLFPELAENSKFLSLYQEDNPMVIKIVKELMLYKLTESESQLKVIEKLLESLILEKY